MMTLVWELDLPDSEKLVLLALADCANDEGHCWPGIAALKKKCSKSDRTVQIAIKMLCTKGHLTRREILGKGCNYTVHPIVRFAPTPEATAPRSDCAPKGTTPTPEAASGKPLRTIISSEAKASSPRAKFPAPCGVSDEQWVAFRQQRKKAINARAYTLLTNKLTKLAEDGWPPGDMIDLAIERGWETVFEPRTPRHGQPASNITSLRGTRPDPALDLLRAARAAENREADRGAGSALPAIGSG